MPYPEINYNEFSTLEKKAVFKIAIELVKADKRIHSKEVMILDRLQSDLKLDQEEIDFIHYYSLSEAISTIRAMESSQIIALLELFNGIIRIDSDISLHENLLISAITMACHEKYRSWARVISAADIRVEIPTNQIIYLEKSFCAKTHETFDDKYDNLLISKALGDVGFDFFYLPSVLSELGLQHLEASGENNRFSLLRKSLSFIMPAGDRGKVNNLASELGSFDSSIFFRVISSGMNLEPDFFPFDSFMLVKIGDSVVLDDNSSSERVTDFLCIDLRADVKKRILSFVSHFDEQRDVIPYEGYYKLLYDHFSAESKINSDIVIDLSYNFCLENLDNQKVPFESAPQTKTLYLLLLKAGKVGIRQRVFMQAAEYLKSLENSSCSNEEGFNLSKIKSQLRELNTDWSILLFNTITIYQALSTKNEQKSNYLTYILSIISHRSSLKNYVNKAFSSIAGLSCPRQYYIQYDKEFGTYHIEAGLSLFYIEEGKGDIAPLSNSAFWNELI